MRSLALLIPVLLLAACDSSVSGERLDGTYVGVKAVEPLNDLFGDAEVVDVRHEMTLSEDGDGGVEGTLVLTHEDTVYISNVVGRRATSGLLTARLAIGGHLITYTATTSNDAGFVGGLMDWPPGTIRPYTVTLERVAE